MGFIEYYFLQSFFQIEVQFAGKKNLNAASITEYIRFLEGKKKR